LKWRKRTSSKIGQVLKTDKFCPTGPDQEAVRWAGPAGRPWPCGGGEGKSAGKKRTGPKVTGKILFRIKFDLFEYTKALEICTRRFRRNFDMRIFF
jgi:hypothetical protein